MCCGDVHCGGGGACKVGEATTAVDGMHPTGMHSCLKDFHRFKT